MRAIAVVMVLIGCGQPAHRVGVAQPEPAPEPVDLIGPSDYASRISGLRATLARSGVDIDTQSKIETCGANDSRQRCVTCDVATRDQTSGLDPDLLDAVSIAFGRYPPGVLGKIKLQHVALCRKIRFSDDPEDGPAGLAVVGEGRVMISVEHFVGDHHLDGFTIEEVVHHEVFHILDGTHDDKEWKALSKGAAGKAGYVDEYAATNDTEDRASTYEYLVGQPAKLCAMMRKDPILTKKVSVVWKRVAPVVGVKQLKRWAPCAARLVK